MKQLSGKGVTLIWNYLNPSLFLSFSKLQSFLLQQQTFLEKCGTWMDLLVQTEQKLAVEVSGNYQRLLEQQREHEASIHVYFYIANTHTIYT